MKAIVSTEPNTASLINNRPLPRLRDDYILVKVKAVALNPTDWKHIDLTTTSGILYGCDYAGVVEDIGTGMTKDFRKGDRVFGFVHGGNSAEPEDGAFAEYIVAKGDLQMRIPDGMSFEEAAAFRVRVTSVSQGLYQTLGLPLPDDGRRTTESEIPILVYGGSTASGILGIQFARLSGYAPIVTCSPHNFELVKEYGAVATFDYGDDDAAEEIREYTNGKLKLIWDTVSISWSAEFCASVMSPEGGKYASLLPMRISAENVESTTTMAYTVFGEDWKMGSMFFPAKKENFEFGKTWFALVEDLISKGRIGPHRIGVGEKGLEGVLDGLQLLRDSKVSGKKLVYRIEDTP
ncbi:oxidoreductase [Patellaria atrata CBS 101060]|uniref:Oxidoreductase n=1 Tax=Patellaria atrata CBS 101060 TaxID=1346257 RepID=A0A9P4VNP1_9PEZI|nr:oxidoreductase [Patellaria atrata CBS 101060]